MSNHVPSIGPASVKIYPRKAYSKLPKGANMLDIWQIVGPTVDMNFRNLPLWQVFCICYFEGLAHGAAATELALKPKTNEDLQLPLL